MMISYIINVYIHLNDLIYLFSNGQYHVFTIHLQRIKQEGTTTIINS